MAFDLSALFAGLGRGAQNLGGSIEDIGQKRQRQQQLDLQQQNLMGARAMQEAAQRSAQENQSRDDALKGIRYGQAPNNEAITHAMDAGGAMGGQFGLAGVQAMKAADTTVNAPDRFQQITPGAYVDNSATPEAIAQRRSTQSDLVTRANAAADRARRVTAMVGTKLPNGQVVDDKLANVMVEAPAVGAAFTKPPEKEPQDHFTVSNAVDANGHPIVINTRTGEEHSSTGKKPVSATAGAASVKEREYANMMEGALPIMEQYAGKVRPGAISLAIKSPTMGNSMLSPDEQAYLNAARTYLAGKMHLESGARLSEAQWQIGTQRYMPTLGDTPATQAAKLAAAKRDAAEYRKMVGGGQDTAPPNAAQTVMHPHVQTIDEMIRAGKSDAEILAAHAQP